jgi:hypothetical protein
MATSPGVLGLSHWELSDVPFWAFTIAALVAWERLGPHNTKRTIAATALTVLAYFTRSAGLPLLVAAGAWLTWRRRWRQLGIFALGVLPFALLWWWRARAQGGVDYMEQFWWVNPYAPELGSINALGLLQRALANSKDYLTEHLPLLLIGRAGKPGTAIATIVVLLALFGWLRRLRHAQVAELFLPLYVGLLLVWPAVWSGERFLVPALPLLLFYAAETLQRLVRRLAPGRVRALSLAAAAVILLLALPATVVGIRWGLACSRLYRDGDQYACMDEGTKDLLRIAELASFALPDSAVILSRKPRLVWAASGGRPGRNYPMSAEPDSLLRAAAEAGAEYVILDRVDRLSQAYLMPALARRPDAFCIVYGYGPARSAILGIRPSPSAAPAPPLPDTARGVQFQICGPEYWRSPDIMESVLQQRAR